MEKVNLNHLTPSTEISSVWIEDLLVQRKRINSLKKTERHLYDSVKQTYIDVRTHAYFTILVQGEVGGSLPRFCF